MEKMNIGLTLTRLAALLIALVCCGSQAYACTCAELTVAQQRDNATAVFLGTVLAKGRSDAVERIGVEVTFRVERVWKGNIHKKAVVYTGATGDLYPIESLCAPLFRVGQNT